MNLEQMIPVTQFCNIYNVPMTFAKALHDHGLLEIESKDNMYFIAISQLDYAEKIIRLHFDLNINLEGIDAITNLLQHIDSLNAQLASLHNRLQCFER